MSNIEQVRLLIADTDSSQFTDAQIQVFLDLASDSVLIAAAYALESWAASLTDSVTSEHIGDYSYTKKTADSKRALALEYKKEAASSLAAEANSPYLTWSEMDLTGDD